MQMGGAREERANTAAPAAAAHWAVSRVEGERCRGKVADVRRDLGADCKATLAAWLGELSRKKKVARKRREPCSDCIQWHLLAKAGQWLFCERCLKEAIRSYAMGPGGHGFVRPLNPLSHVAADRNCPLTNPSPPNSASTTPDSKAPPKEHLASERTAAFSDENDQDNEKDENDENDAAGADADVGAAELCGVCGRAGHDYKGCSFK